MYLFQNYQTEILTYNYPKQLKEPSIIQQIQGTSSQNQPNLTAFQTVSTATTIVVAITMFCIGGFVIIDLQMSNWIDDHSWQSPKIYSSIFDLTIGTLVPAGVILRNKSIRYYIIRNNKWILAFCNKCRRKNQIKVLKTRSNPNVYML